MVISIEESNTNPWQQAAQSMMSAGIGSLSGNVMDPPQNLNIDPEASKWNYNKAQVNMNEPIARELLRESYRTDQEQGIQNWFQDTGPTYDPNTWIVNSFNRGQPIMKAGITNPNLGGAKVWNAADYSPFGLYEKFLEPYMPWYDKEQDEKRYKPFVDPELEEDRLKADEEARAEWFAEYGPRGTGEYYPDKILRDAFPESYPYLGDLPTGTPDMMEEPTKEPDIGPYTLEALNLQDAMDAHEALGLPLNTDRFTRRANKAGVQVTNRGGLMSLV